MGWIEVYKGFSIYSLRDDFVQYIDWVLYFIESFYLYFLFVAVVILVGLILFALIKRMRNFSNKADRF